MTVHLGLNYIDKYKENSVTTKTQLLIPGKTKETRKIKVIHRSRGACAQLCQTFCNSILQPEYWSGFFLLQRIFPTQGSKPCLLHCRQILYPLSHQGSPLEFFRQEYWSRLPSPPPGQNHVSCIVNCLPLSHLGSLYM